MSEFVLNKPLFWTTNNSM